MHLAIEQIANSLENLEDVHPFFGFAFLGFKKFGLPVGRMTPFHYPSFKDLILDPYYKVIPGFDRYYSPFRTSSRAQRWVSPRYESTSLQRIVADTFGEAFLREPKSSKWGWKHDYIRVLELLRFRYRLDPMPILDIASWMYRDVAWPPDVDGTHLVQRFISEFEITAEEQESLFALDTNLFGCRFADEPYELEDLLDVIGDPRAKSTRSVSGLIAIAMEGTGPGGRLSYDSASRLNVITGDNSLGKTFLLDSVWWSLTGEWSGPYAAAPNPHDGKQEASLTFQLRDAERETRSYDFVARYEPRQNVWKRRDDHYFSGVGIYSRSDGNFAVWDSERHFPPVRPAYSLTEGVRHHEVMSRRELWDGLEGLSPAGPKVVVCNGLLQDWVQWQRAPANYGPRFESFSRIVDELFPGDDESVAIAEPERIAGDARDLPALMMPYGKVPIVLASAAVQRVLTLAYLITWAWYEHLDALKIAGKRTRANMLVIVDEIEAHLHPKWQRTILPSLLSVVQSLVGRGQKQMHVATHSPMVMTSLEQVFEAKTDALHHLSLDDHRGVILDQLDFAKLGTVNDWLRSPVFDSQSP
ncbi:MAG: AAA family ATPase, partial [Reyranellaceae bacterium]